MKNSFILFHEGQEYTKEYDGQTLHKIFPNLKKIEFYLKLKKTKDEMDENEHDQISVKYNIKEGNQNENSSPYSDKNRKFNLITIAKFFFNFLFYIAFLAKKAYVMNAFLLLIIIMK